MAKAFITHNSVELHRSFDELVLSYIVGGNLIRCGKLCLWLTCVQNLYTAAWLCLPNACLHTIAWKVLCNDTSILSVPFAQATMQL